MALRPFINLRATLILSRSYRVMSSGNKFISNDEVAALIRDKAKIPGKDYLIVDVRGDDYIGGHIPGALNVPSHELVDRIPSMINDYEHVPRIIFHCAMSQIRGPKAAQIYKESLQLHNAGKNQEICVLKDGFEGWEQKFRDHPDLIEDYDPELWKEGYNF